MMSIIEANNEVLKRLQTAEPRLVDITTVGAVAPEADKYTLFHAGPPITWEHMSGPMKGAVYAALIYEGVAGSPEEAGRVAADGKITFRPCHEVGMVGPMTGITSVSMPLYAVRNEKYGNIAYSTINEGMGNVIRFGAYEQETIDRLRWIETVYAPVLKDLVMREKDGIDLGAFIGKALQMGDELHMRNAASTVMFRDFLYARLIELGISTKTLCEIARFLSGKNDQLFLNLVMTANKAAADAADGIFPSSIVTAIARNGYEVGIRISGLPGQWFTTPAPPVDALFFPGFSKEDACPDLGDSAILEVLGMGAFAMGVAPALVPFLGMQGAENALKTTAEMYEICHGEHTRYRSAFNGERGLPLGIDIMSVVDLQKRPKINTAVASKEAGVGMIGAGVSEVPLEPFVEALIALDEATENVAHNN